MPYDRIIPIEFNHCDPAGIVFYPRYFEMTNSVCENFFADVVGRSYARIIADGDGIPTVRLEVSFRAPSRLGEKLRFRLWITGVGRSSVDCRIVASCAGETRIEVVKRLVWLGGGMRAAPWPDEMRAVLQAQMEGDGDDRQSA
ncbi:thioesterase family protein [uncultured Paracoccus sp.]|uniref:acyl-CoA thioesterase n=1 Tax=uncultured Paracoccus sp. TaxID=189685 RepID=UPI0026164711|nr:thioesterase family protein [uncultured Paracoccus sp.]